MSIYITTLILTRSQHQKNSIKIYPTGLNRLKEEDDENNTKMKFLKCSQKLYNSNLCKQLSIRTRILCHAAVGNLKKNQILIYALSGVGSWLRIDPLHLLTGCRKRRANQVPLRVLI